MGRLHAMERTTETDDLGVWDAHSFAERIATVAPGVIYVFNQVTASNEYSNRELGLTLGYTSEEVRDLGADLMPRLCHPDDLPAMGEYFAALRDMADGQISQFEYRMRHKDGHWVWLLSQDTVFDRTETGAVLRHIGIATDISVQKAAEADARAKTRAANEANEELKSFAYSISHDMKAPSNTMHLILNELEETQSDKFDNEGRELVALGLKTVQRMQRLIDDVLRYTRVVGDDLEKVPVALSSMAHDILSDLRADIEERDARVKIGPLPEVFGNEMQLRILLTNLVSNALKFGAPGVKPIVRVTDVSNPASDHIAIEVADNGIGIAAEFQDRIFTMFKRLHLQEDYEGSGLGLAICRRIAMAHGGNIEVASEQGKGAVFTLTLPQSDRT